MKRLLFQLIAFSKNSVLEAFRNKILYAVLVASALTIGAASAFGALSLGQEERVFHNLTLFVGMLFLVALTIYQGVTSLHREIESKTIFTVLSKPVQRSAFLAGKFVASAVVIAVCATLIFGLTMMVATLLGYTITIIHLFTYITGFLQLIILLALAHFFGTFSGPIMSALFSFFIFLLGSLTPQLEDAARQFARQENPIHLALEAALWIVPDLEKLNLSYELTHQIPISTTYIAHAIVYTGSLTLILLFFSSVIFARRDFA